MSQSHSPSSKRRILFVAEAVTLAHVARPLALALTLDPARYEILFACSPRYNDLFNTKHIRLLPIYSISNGKFLQSLAQGRRLYNSATLSAYVTEDLTIIEQCKPDVIVGDFRLSLSVSARLARTPYITISNAYWSPYAQPRFTVPELPLVKFGGLKLGQLLFDLARPLAFAYHALPLNRLRRCHGLTQLGHDLRQVYTDADYTLYADIPQLIPTYSLPDTHGYAGPTLWSPSNPLPEWWEIIPEARPTIYVTLGSSGNSELLQMVLKALATAPVTIIAASAGRAVSRDTHPANAYVSQYLPGERAAQRAALVISNGGSQTSYQAFAYGKPVIGIPSNLDQHLNMGYVQAAGAGLVIRAESATPASIRTSVDEILRTQRYTEKAQRLMKFISTFPRNSFEETIVRACLSAVPTSPSS